jgi:uncharacterized repeat protein (TIGR02543 family)
MKNKKFLFTLLAFSLALPLAACGGGGENTSAQASEVTSAVTTSQTVTTVAPTTVAVYTVTFDLNDGGSAAPSVVNVNGGSAVTKPADPTRTGYVFNGWCTDKAGTIAFDFSAKVTASLTLYASWISESVKTYTVTFNYNYSGAPAASTKKVEEGQAVAKPSDPTRDGSGFSGWYTEAGCVNKYDFTSAVTADLTLYAGWNTIYTFEAEYCPDIVDLYGPGYSGTATGTDMISHDDGGKFGASNGYYVTYLYASGITLSFTINSDKDVSDASFTFRIAAEYKDITISPTNYTVEVNGSGLAYDDIVFTNVPSNGMVAFSDHLLTTSLALKKGVNKISLITSNSDPMVGTMSATAPVVDCFKIGTSAVLTWTPDTENTVGR